MKRQTVAIVGLGRVGAAFLEQVLSNLHPGVDIAYAVEIAETKGKQKAIDAGIAIVSMDELIAKGESVDVIFELTGLTDVRDDLRIRLQEAGNNYTIIASESIAKIIWSFISKEQFVDIEGRHVGY
jgi:predicted dinucleotide-utilizing enzyme